MNILESCTTENPNAVVEECARFIIDSPANPFIFSNISTEGKQYTLTFWTRSDLPGRMTAAGIDVDVNENWEKHSFTYTASGTSLFLCFHTAATYHIYHAKLELGNVSTDWSPAPEDADDNISTVDQDLQVLRESVSQLSVDADGIQTSVSKVEESLNSVTGELEKTKEEIAQANLSADKLTVEIRKITDDGVEKVTNTTGTFDEKGLTVDNSDSPTKTAITPDGMIVYRKAGAAEESVLTATSDGVDATNLHAKTYLILGGRSRFENYETDRTGCFWIGEN